MSKKYETVSQPGRYIPALHFKRLTSLYDPLLRWVMFEATFKKRLIQLANMGPQMKTLDLGCGTGTLTIMLKQAHPDMEITGLDADPQVLDIARKKSHGMNIYWEEGLASRLPYPDSKFDRVVSSLMIHHLVKEEKRQAFIEIYRVLKPQGELILLDFGAPNSLLTRFLATGMRRLEEVADNFDGLIPTFIMDAGFKSVSEAEYFVTVFGPLSLWRAVKG